VIVELCASETVRDRFEPSGSRRIRKKIFELPSEGRFEAAFEAASADGLLCEEIAGNAGADL
jgi:hypothetical protein